MSFSPAQLIKQLASCPVAKRYWVAFSGGLDSHVLLHALANSKSDSALDSALTDIEVHAVHIHHGLQADADHWTEHCTSVCEALSIPIEIIHVDARAKSGESPEAAARKVRYEALAGVMQQGDCLLTAQHQNDQAETLLLQLFRGSGPHGVAAMPGYTEFSHGTHLRPLLEFTRADLHAYAKQEGLEWVEDRSNQDTAYDRNYLRNEVMPHLNSRWPSISATLARSASHFAEAAALTDELGMLDLAQVTGTDKGMLSIIGLKNLSDSRCKNVLRVWLKQLHLPLPTTAQLQHIIHDAIESEQDARPCVKWNGVEVRRYRDYLYAMSPLSQHDATMELHWNLKKPLALNVLGGRLLPKSVTGTGLNASLCANDGVVVRFRQGGETGRPAGRGHEHSLKKLFQEKGIPPWQRDRIPLIYVDDQLASVPGLWVFEPSQASKQDPGISIEWEIDR